MVYTHKIINNFVNTLLEWVEAPLWRLINMIMSCIIRWYFTMCPIKIWEMLTSVPGTLVKESNIVRITLELVLLTFQKHKKC